MTTFNVGDRVAYTDDRLNAEPRHGTITFVYPEIPGIDGPGYMIHWDGDPEPDDDHIYNDRRLSPGTRPDPITEAINVLIGAGRQDLAGHIARTNHPARSDAKPAASTDHAYDALAALDGIADAETDDEARLMAATAQTHALLAIAGELCALREAVAR